MVYFHPSAVAIVSHDQMKIIKYIRLELANVADVRCAPISIFSLLSPSSDTVFLFLSAQVASIIKKEYQLVSFQNVPCECGLEIFEKVVHHCASLTSLENI